MTVRRTLLKLLYPFLRTISALVAGRKSIRSNADGVVANESFYALQGLLNDGSSFTFSRLANKKVLLVNLASDCGYTPQYKELQQLQEMYSNSLLILGFPANDFKGQEPGSDSEIKTFCEINYSISFPLFQKHSVLRPFQNTIFKWLSHKGLNGWNNQQPVWNFCKYLVGEDGKLLYFFPPFVSPLSEVMKSAINAPLVLKGSV